MTTTTAAKDAALAAVTSGGTKWVVLLTGAPSAASGAGLHAVRFEGAPAEQVASGAWSSPSGAAVRQVSNSSAITFDQVAGLSGTISVVGWALVSTSDGQVPNAASTFSNVSTVWFLGDLVAPLSVSNNDQPRFVAGSLVVEAAES